MPNFYKAPRAPDSRIEDRTGGMKTWDRFLTDLANAGNFTASEGKKMFNFMRDTIKGEPIPFKDKSPADLLSDKDLLRMHMIDGFLVRKDLGPDYKQIVKEYAIREATKNRTGVYPKGYRDLWDGYRSAYDMR